tara:strand:+ start:228 stop:509 length:282 start_codon:yes stop_codon:yes gene_type:complete
MTAKKFPRAKTRMERQIDIDNLLDSGNNLSKAVKAVLTLASECFTVELSALEKMADTFNDYSVARRQYWIDTVNDEWDPDHSHICNYEDPSYG